MLCFPKPNVLDNHSLSVRQGPVLGCEQSGPHELIRATSTQCSEQTNSCLLPPRSGGWGTKIQVLSGLVSFNTSFLSLLMTMFSLVKDTA